MRASCVGVLVVLGELGDVEPAVLVEVDGDRAAQQRLGGDQLDVEAGPDCQRFERLGRIFERNPRQLGGVVLLGGSRLCARVSSLAPLTAPERPAE